MSPPIDELLTTAPLPCSRVCRNSYFMQFQTPRRLMPMGRSYSSLLASAISATGLCTPGLYPPRAGAIPPGIVEPRVEPPEGRDDPLAPGRHRVAVGDVATNAN